MVLKNVIDDIFNLAQKPHAVKGDFGCLNEYTA